MKRVVCVFAFLLYASSLIHAGVTGLLGIGPSRTMVAPGEEKMNRNEEE